MTFSHDFCEILIDMASRDNKKASRASSSRTGKIRTLSDLNRPSADSDSDSDGPQEYYTGGEKRFSSFLIILFFSSYLLMLQFLNSINQQNTIRNNGKVFLSQFIFKSTL